MDINWKVAMRGYMDRQLWSQMPDEEFFKLAAQYHQESSAIDTKEVLTVWGTLVFTNREPGFGSTSFMTLREHGDLGCSCKSCTLADTISKQREKGWYCIEFKSA